MHHTLAEGSGICKGASIGGVFCNPDLRVKSFIMGMNGLYHQIYRRWYGTPRYKSGLYGPNYENVSGIREDIEIRRDVEESLSASHDIKGSVVEVAVEEGVAMLTGSVPDLERKRLAGDIAWAVPGVVDVVNELIPGNTEPQNGG